MVNTEPKIIFIGGTGRCGTNILKNILSKNSTIATIDIELRFLFDSDGILPFLYTLSHNWDPFIYDRSVKRLRKLLLKFTSSGSYKYYKALVSKTGINKCCSLNLLPPYGRKNINDYCDDYVQLVDNLIRNLIKFKYKGSWVGMELLDKKELWYNSYKDRSDIVDSLRYFINKIITNIINHQNSRVFLDNTVWSLIYFRDLLELLPDAKLIHIYRDPRDIVSSWKTKRYAPSNVIQGAKYYSDIMDKWLENKPLISKQSYVEISLDNLIDDTKNTLAYICDTLCISWDDAMLNIDLSKSNKGRWKNDIPKKELFDVMKILQPYLDLLGIKDR